MEKHADNEFPENFVAECVRRYRRPSRDHPQFSQARIEGRSFPTGYCVGEPGEQFLDHIIHVLADLGEPENRWKQAAQSTAADLRVLAGPSDQDHEALPHIDDAYCVAEFICDEQLGMRATHVRYGVALDWITRDVAQRLARDRDNATAEDRYRRYGLDPYRVALEHGADPKEIDDIAARATLRKPGTLVPVEVRPLFRKRPWDRILYPMSRRLRKLPSEHTPALWLGDSGPEGPVD